ncbi:MAG: hypothetical protein NVS4B3_13740 [Gemmatimonadaceae bacterium]
MTTAPPRTHLRIGELAAEFALNPKTIRYYEEIDLLRPPQRSPAGYRLYDTRDRERLQFIVRAKQAGFTLDEIKDVLSLSEAGRQPCGHVLGLLDRKLTVVSEQLSALNDYRERLLVVRRDAAKRVRANACICGIIEYDTPDDTEAHRTAAPSTFPSPPRRAPGPFVAKSRARRSR